MTYTMRLTSRARKQYRRLDKTDQQRINQALDKLAVNPRPAGVKALVGVAGALRIRVGDLRIAYEIHDQKLVILVFYLAHRGDDYRSL